MNDFEYYAPTTLAEAATLLKQNTGRAKVLAGGTDIIVQLREGLRSAETIVDVKKIPELLELSYTSGKELRFGASVPCYRLYEHAEIKRDYSALTDSAHIIGGWQIQSRASIGGNLCNSSPAADSVPSLIALDATAHIASAQGTRVVKVSDFCTAPGKNVLQPGELVATLVLPPKTARSGSAYERFIPRNEMDIAVVGVGCWVQLSTSGDTIENARICVGAVAPTAKFATAASDYLKNKPATDDSFRAAGDLARQVAAPITDMRGTAEYRTHLVGVLVARTLAKAVERARTK